MKPSAGNLRRVVVKVGSSLLYTDKNTRTADPSVVKNIARQSATLVKSGVEVIIVSSGAIGLGMSKLGLRARPKELSLLQAAAAVGQNELMNIYRQVFSSCGLLCGQVLLTWEDFVERRRYLNAKTTLQKLLQLGIVPVVNENDTVAVDEIKFGDNDKLSALVAGMVAAGLLLNLSDVDGLLTGDRKSVIREVGAITADIRKVAAPSKNRSSVGGMITKLDSAGIAMKSGIPYVIANGRGKDTVSLAVEDPRSTGTLFSPGKGRLTARERWIAFGSRAKGRIFVDDGARKALLCRKSLLCVGIVGSEGTFRTGDIVCISDAKKNDFARGKAGLPADTIASMKGKHFFKEAVHCDDIVIL
ncbi:MAG: glutamate 5-kinase [Candidatus Omnitrophota bacterium]